MRRKNHQIISNLIKNASSFSVYIVFSAQNAYFRSILENIPPLVASRILVTCEGYMFVSHTRPNFCFVPDCINVNHLMQDSNSQVISGDILRLHDFFLL